MSLRFTRRVSLLRRAAASGPFPPNRLSRAHDPAIKATLPDGADSLPPQPDGRLAVRIWLDRKFIDRLAQMRGPGESYSDVIVRLAEASEGA